MQKCARKSRISEKHYFARQFTRTFAIKYGSETGGIAKI
jgi:hypothetical protein